MFAPLNANQNTLTAPLSLFTLEPVTQGVVDRTRKDPPVVNSLIGRITNPTVNDTMTPHHAWTCFDTHGNGHFQSADQLYDSGVWIGYLAEES